LNREITIITPEQAELKFELAGLGSRFIATLLDTLIQTLVLVVFALVALIVAVAAGISLVAQSNRLASSTITALVIIGVLVVLLVLDGYYLFFEARTNGQTPGKKLVGIRVIRDTGHPVDFRAALIRNLIRTLDFTPWPSHAIGLIAIFVSPQYRRIGDYVAGTLVVRIPTNMQPSPQGASPSHSAPPDPPGAADTPEDRPVQSPSPRLPEELLPYLHSITRDDYRAVRHFLSRQYELDPALAHSLASRLAESLSRKLGMNPVGVGDPVVFLTALAAEWERRMIR
jgi:uncharacterized RDD family membrane protein YckC